MLKNCFTDSFGNHIDWIDAAALLPILPGFLLLGVWTLITMNNRPKSMSIGEAALVMRFYLFVMGSLSWWLIDSPVLGWSAWAVIAGAFAATFAKLNKWN